MRLSGQVTNEDLTNYYRMAVLLVDSVDPLAAVWDLSAVTSCKGTPEII